MQTRYWLTGAVQEIVYQRNQSAPEAGFGLALDASYERKSRIATKRLSTGHGGLEEDCRRLPEPLNAESRLANHQHTRSLRAALVCDVPHSDRVLVDHRAVGDPHGRVSGTGVYHFPRLRAWLVFQIPQSE